MNWSRKSNRRTRSAARLSPNLLSARPASFPPTPGLCCCALATAAPLVSCAASSAPAAFRSRAEAFARLFPAEAGRPLRAAAYEAARRNGAIPLVQRLAPALRRRRTGSPRQREAVWPQKAECCFVTAYVSPFPLPPYLRTVFHGSAGVFARPSFGRSKAVRRRNLHPKRWHMDFPALKQTALCRTVVLSQNTRVRYIESLGRLGATAPERPFLFFGSFPNSRLRGFPDGLLGGHLGSSNGR